MELRRNRHDLLGGVQCQMREKAFSIGDDYWIETPEGERAFKVNGKALRLRDTLELESPSGQTLLKIQEKKLSIRDTMHIEHDGDTVAAVKKALVGLRDRFTIKVEAGDEQKATGNVVDHEYALERDGRNVAEVSKRAGSGYATPTASTSPPARTCRGSWCPRSASTA